MITSNSYSHTQCIFLHPERDISGANLPGEGSCLGSAEGFPDKRAQEDSGHLSLRNLPWRGKRRFWPWQPHSILGGSPRVGAEI